MRPRDHLATTPVLVAGPGADFSDEAEASTPNEMPVAEALEAGRDSWEEARRVAAAALRDHPTEVGKRILEAYVNRTGK